jgi:predicted DNA-binding protein YlxM (UPF0122 family)
MFNYEEDRLILRIDLRKKINQLYNFYYTKKCNKKISPMIYLIEYYWFGYTLKEIGSIFGITPPGVRAKIIRGIKDIKRRKLTRNNSAN